MDVAESVPPLPERRELVRRFSNDIGPTVKYTNAIHAVADYTKQDRVKEAAKWRLHFQGPSTTRYVYGELLTELTLAKVKPLVVVI